MLQAFNQTDYDRTRLRRMLEPALLDTGVYQRLQERGTRVLLKPNFVMAAPADDASTTHPNFYMTIAKLLTERGFQVGIGESPALGSCANALAAHGVLDECETLGVEVVEFKKAADYAGVSGHRQFSELSIAAELTAWDSLINLPKLKTHKQFVFTGATKNLYGCVVGKRKFIRHNLCGNDVVAFARMIIKNAERANAAIHIADGIHALHVTGPRGGVPFALGRILISTDPLTLDWVFARMIGLEPDNTPLFRALPDLRHQRNNYDTVNATICDEFPPVDGFQHAPQIHISFAPWALARSCMRTIRHQLGITAGV